MTVIWSVEACSRHCPKSFRDEGGYQIVNIVNNNNNHHHPHPPLIVALSFWHG
jgi:hypothetical protein